MVRYSNEVADKICERIAAGESIRAICQDEGMPDRSNVLRWMETHEDFASKCARARELQADAVHDQMIEIEDGVICGSIPPDVARVALSSKQWRAAKLKPKAYGNKVTQEHTGFNGAPLVLWQADPSSSEK